MKIKSRIEKYLGNKEFIQNYWKIALPAFLWAIFVSLAPIFATIFITSLLPNYLFGVANTTLNNIYNYNIFGYSYIDILAVIFVMSSFSIVGNFIAKKDIKKLNDILKDVLNLSIILAIIITIFMAVYASNFEQKLLGFSGTYLSYGSVFMQWASVSIILYMLDWFFISSFSCLNLIWVQCFSAIIGFCFYILILALYSFNLHHINDVNKLVVVRNYAIIYDAWYLIQIAFIFGYCYLPKVIRLEKDNKKWKFVKVDNIAYEYFYFLRKINFKINWNLLKFYFMYSYWIMLDVAIWAIADIFSQIGGVIDPHAGLNAQNQKIYHQIILLCAQYSTYLYIFFNGFGLITNIYLSIPLGKQQIKKAKENTTKMFWWGFIIACFLLIMVFSISYELNMYLIGGIKKPYAYWSFQNDINGKITTSSFTYKQLWNMGMIMSCIYGVYMYINIMFNNVYYFEISGNSRWIMLSDAGISVIYAILTWCLILTNDNLNNLFCWYALNKSYVLWKLMIGLIIIKCKKSLNSVDCPNWEFKKDTYNKYLIKKIKDIKIVD